MKQSGITLIALVVTIVVLMILAGVSISMLGGENGIITQATEAQIMTELANVKEALEIYRLKDIEKGPLSDEQLVEEGLLKEVFIKDTYRTVAIITNLKTIDISSNFGKGGEKQEESEIGTILDLYNVYGVDMEDGTLYYIRNGIWSIEGNKITYTSDAGEEKEGYVVETINQRYLEERKFITEWTVEEGTTITLPITQAPDITIEWGADDNGDGELDIDKCTIIEPTHTYTVAGTYIIKISGNMPSWEFKLNTTSNCYITGIKQWGNVGVRSISFHSCANLEGTIPSHKTKGEFSNLKTADCLFLNCSKLSGSIPEDLFKEGETIKSFKLTFYGCTGLTGSIPNRIFANNTSVQSFEGVFSECSGLTGEIPEDLFYTNTEVTDVSGAFRGCTGLTGKISGGLFKNCPKIENCQSLFSNTLFIEIPENLFDTNKGQTNVITNMVAVFANTPIKTIPEGLFDLCTEATKFGFDTEGGTSGVFQNCTSLETIPEKLFYNNTKVTSFANAFFGCKNLKEIPENLFNTAAQNVSMFQTFSFCESLKKIPGRIFENVSDISNLNSTFRYCIELEEVGEGFEVNSNVEEMYSTFAFCSKLSKVPNIVIPETVSNLSNIFNRCYNLQTTVILKSNPTEYEGAFEYVKSSLFKLNWASPCTEEKVDEILAATGGSKLKGVEVIE